MNTPSHQTLYPVLYAQLEPADHGYAQGYRYLVEDPEGGRFFFRAKDGERGSDRFLRLHALKPVSPEEMQALRDHQRDTNA